ncbi:protachykinin-1-like [Protopterus annectens]|uniref:protachykinin-1-like n=1 Tax=Protopterus annectens TaxID=7888 RepID=UPI001CF9D28D|nr:protachykinin-1-like [Protopterus annectens]
MKSWKLLALLTVVFASVLCYEETSPPQEKALDWPVNWKNVPSQNVISEVAEMVKRAKHMQFYGLMGKRNSGNKIQKINPVSQKRYKGDMFFGLMGRRSSSGELPEDYEKSTFYVRRRK